MSRPATQGRYGFAAALLAVAGCIQADPQVRTPTPDAAAAAAAPITAAAEPSLASMRVAEAPQKLGAPVDLRYQFDGEVRDGQAFTLHLAAVPRVAGTNLTVSVKQESGISIPPGMLSAQKAAVSTAYRQQLSVTKRAGGPAALQVLVTMETPAGSAHSWFSIPLGAPAPAAGKQAPLKLE